MPLADLEAFRKNPLVQDAVVRNLEIIGEAVSKIQKASPDFIKQLPEVPWTQMRGMRNVAIHEYFFVDLEIVWTTVKHDLPAELQLGTKDAEEICAARAVISDGLLYAFRGLASLISESE